MKKILAILAAFLAPLPASAQQVRQSGNVTPGHVATWTTTGVIGDGGTPGGSSFTGSTTTNDFACAGAGGSLIDCGLSSTGTINWTGLQNLNGGATAPTRPSGDNTTNVATTAFVLAQAGGVTVSGTPSAGYVPIATNGTTAAWGVTWPTSNFFFSQNGALILRPNDRMLGGGASANDGTATGDQDWLAVFQKAQAGGPTHGSVTSAQGAFLTATQSGAAVSAGYGWVTGTRSLNFTSTATSAIGLGSFAVNNNATLATNAWAFYGECHEVNTTVNACIGMEIEPRAVAQAGATPDPFMQGTVNGHQIGCGAGMTVTFDCSAGIQIVANPDKFKVGLNIMSGSITSGGGPGGTTIGIAMPTGVHAAWYTGIGTLGGYMTFDGSGNFQLVGNNNQIQLGGVTASFPAIKRNGAALNFKLADGSGDAAITSAAITASDQIQTLPASGAASITLAPQAATQQASIFFSQTATNYWQMGKQTNNSFFLFDTVRNANAVAIPSNGNMTLMPTSGNVVIGPGPIATFTSGGGEQVGAPTGGDKGNGTLNAQGALFEQGTQVVGARITGYTAMTGTPDKATSYATSTVTLAQLAGRVMQLQADLTTHGLIGP